MDSKCKSNVIQLHSETRKARKCNICGRRFTAGNAFLMFCRNCRESSELYRFSEWLPDGAFEPAAEDNQETETAA